MDSDGTSGGRKAFKHFLTRSCPRQLPSFNNLLQGIRRSAPRGSKAGCRRLQCRLSLHAARALPTVLIFNDELRIAG